MCRELTQKQEKFVQEYILNGGNASAAYRAAYNCSKWKDNVINVKASELLKNGNVMVRLNKQKEIIQGDVHSIIKINKMILGTGSIKRYSKHSPSSTLISQQCLE